MFVKKEKNWEKASSKCQEWGTDIAGNLVTIPDMDTMNFIIETLNNTLQWTYESFWIGLNARNSGWKWATGKYPDKRDSKSIYKNVHYTHDQGKDLGLELRLRCEGRSQRR